MLGSDLRFQGVALSTGSVMGRTFHHLRVDIHLTGRACWKRIASDATSSRDNNARFSSRQLLACAEILLRCSRLSQEVCSVGFRLWRLCVQSQSKERSREFIFSLCLRRWQHLVPAPTHERYPSGIALAVHVDVCQRDMWQVLALFDNPPLPSTAS